MRSALGLIFANLLLMAAGVGVMQIIGAIGLSSRRVLPALPLALLCGFAAVALTSIALATIGIPLGVVTNFLICVAFASAGAVLAKRRPRDETQMLHTEQDERSSIFWPLVGWQRTAVKALLWLTAAVMTLFAVVVIRHYGVPTVYVWDEWAIWSKKAVALYHFGGLEPDFFAGPAYASMHQDYPIGLPAVEAFIFSFMGRTDTATMHIQFVILLSAFAGSAAYLCVRRGANLLFVPFLLVVLIMPGTHSVLATGYADMPLAFFVATGALSMGLWLEDGRRSRLPLAALLLAGAASIKAEGLFALFFVFAGAGVILVVRRSWRDLGRLVIVGIAAAAAQLPWRIWVHLHPEIKSFFSLSDGFNLGYLRNEWDVGRSAYGTIRDMLLHDQYVMLFPTACAIVLACLLARATRATALFYIFATLGTAAAIGWTNWVEPVVALERAILSVLFIAIAAVLQLSGSASRALREGGDA